MNAGYRVTTGGGDLKNLGRKEQTEGVILPARDYEDAAQIHGRPRIPAAFEKKAKKRRLLELAKERMMERPNGNT